MPLKTLADWLDHASRTLADSEYNDTPRLDAELLARHTLQVSRANVFAHPEQSISQAQWDSLMMLLTRRVSGEPMAYITGKREFWSTELSVSSGVLVPRPETETLVEAALNKIGSTPEGYILDLGTGSGAIAIALAQELPKQTVIAIDRETAALSTAASNVKDARLGNVLLVQGHWLDCIRQRCAGLVLANPPYLASNDTHLDSLSYEPVSALVSGPGGLEDLMHIIEQAQRVALPGAIVMLEHGSQQAFEVREQFTTNHYHDVHTIKDLAGHDRVSYASVPTKHLPKAST